MRGTGEGTLVSGKEPDTESGTGPGTGGVQKCREQHRGSGRNGGVQNYEDTHMFGSDPAPREDTGKMSPLRHGSRSSYCG